MKRSRKFFGQVWQRLTDSRRAWQLWAFSLFTILLAAGLILSRWRAASGQSVPTASGPADSGNADQVIIQGLRRALSSSRLDAADRQALEKKLAYSERLAQQRAVKPQDHQPKPKDALVAPVQIPRADGFSTQPAEQIISGSEGLVHPWEASINNLWEGTYNGVPYQVLAGSVPNDPSQGLVIVIESPSGQAQPFQHTYRAPAHSGALRIVARQDGRLQCAAADGSTLFFDLAARTFRP